MPKKRKSASPSAPAIVRDRIQDLRRIPVAALKAHPRNWRTHPKAQREAMAGVLAKIGYADALVVRPLADGFFEILDGHLRAELDPNAEVPCLVVDLDDSESEHFLLTHDPLGAMADAAADVLDGLIQAVPIDDEAVRAMVVDLAEEHLLEKPGKSRSKAADGEAEESAPVQSVPEKWQIVVDCDGEEDQRTLFERLREEGRTCRLLTL